MYTKKPLHSTVIKDVEIWKHNRNEGIRKSKYLSNHLLKVKSKENMKPKSNSHSIQPTKT